MSQLLIIIPQMEELKTEELRLGYSMNIVEDKLIYINIMIK